VITRAYFKEIFEKNDRQDQIIDGIRAISVLCIIAFHVAVGIIQVYDKERAKEYIVDMPALLQPLWHFEKGVDAFFLISALVLGIPLFKRAGAFGWNETKSFYKKRFFRIYPLFLVALVIYAIPQWSYFGKYFFSNLFLVNNLIPGHRTIIPVGWSLLVEVQYYAVLPILFVLLSRIQRKAEFLIGLIAGSFLVCGAILLAHPALFQRPLTDIYLAADKDAFSELYGAWMYQGDLARFGPFAVGLLLAYLRVACTSELTEVFKKRSAGIVLFFTSLLFLLPAITVPLYNPNSWYYQPFSPVFNLFTLATIRQFFSIGLAGIIVGCWHSNLAPFDLLRGLLKLRIWLPLSRLSFPIYLFHFPMVAVAAIAVFRTTNVKEIVSVSFAQGSSIFLLAAALSVLFSIPLYIYIERPFIERGKKS
jgi:peptidoglycan/LPS O-acetylase OafA/YrhL